MAKETFSPAYQGCLVPECPRRAPHLRPFCDTHWALLPGSLRDGVLVETLSGGEFWQTEAAIDYLIEAA